MSRSFRTNKTSQAYRRVREGDVQHSACRLCQLETISAFNHWRIVSNDFPYDRVADEHFILLPKRHVTEVDLTDEELDELLEIKRRDEVTRHHFIFESTAKKVSIPAHFHLHLITIKDMVD